MSELIVELLGPCLLLNYWARLVTPPLLGPCHANVHASCTDSAIHGEHLTARMGSEFSDSTSLAHLWHSWPEDMQSLGSALVSALQIHAPCWLFHLYNIFLMPIYKYFEYLISSHLPIQILSSNFLLPLLIILYPHVHSCTHQKITTKKWHKEVLNPKPHVNINLN